MAEPKSVTSAILAGIGAAALIAGVLVAKSNAFGPPRPDASGDVGVLAIYAQTAFGPVRLVAGERRELTRPQDFAFQFTCEGTGPRVVRIEMKTDGEPEILNEVKMNCPANMESLGYVLKLDDKAPNDVELSTIVEAPHDHLRVHRFPITLGSH